MIAPHVPNNIGSLSCFDIETEPHTMVDPIRPSPVTSRHVTGQMLADAVFGCLCQALPGKVQAESAGSIWMLMFNSAHGRVGARRTAKAHSICDVWPSGLVASAAGPARTVSLAMAFPSGIGGIPVEIIEGQCPLVV